MVEVARDARARAELARAELRLGRAVDPAIPAAEVAMREHAVAELAAEVEDAGTRGGREIVPAGTDCGPEVEEVARPPLELAPQGHPRGRRAASRRRPTARSGISPGCGWRRHRGTTRTPPRNRDGARSRDRRGRPCRAPPAGPTGDATPSARTRAPSG